MKKFLRELLVVALLGVTSVGAFAQRKEQDKRPPKEPGKVVTPEKQREPPPQNTNRPKPDNKKKPY